MRPRVRRPRSARELAALAAGRVPCPRLGVVDTVLAARPALATWDANFARALR